MSSAFYKNGFLIKSYEEQSSYKGDDTYLGIGRYITWPLDTLTDTVSVSLTTEALERWFGYQDNRLYVVPDLEYLKRYAYHCRELNISIFCMQVESSNSIITTAVSLPVVRCLGYEYVDVDMSTSCMREDLVMTDSYIQNAFSPIKKSLNKYGLFDSTYSIQQYEKCRNQLINEGYDMEEYFCPTVVRLSEVTINTGDGSLC